MTTTTEQWCRAPGAGILIGGPCPPPVFRLLANGRRPIVRAATLDEFLWLRGRSRFTLCVWFAGAPDAADADLVARRATGEPALVVVSGHGGTAVRAPVGDARCVHLICAGERDHETVGRMLAAAAAAPPRYTDGETPLGRLSPREREALQLISAGYTHDQAARRMRVTKATVDTFIARARTKLGAGNKADLTRAALVLPAPPAPPPHR